MVIIYRYSELTSRRIKIFTKLGKGKITSVVFTDFRNPLNHNLSFSQETFLHLTKGYLENHKQRINAKSNFS